MLIATIGSGMEHNKLKLASRLWKEGIGAEILYYKEAKSQKQLTEALEKEIPFLIWIGENEMKENIYKVKGRKLLSLFLNNFKYLIRTE